MNDDKVWTVNDDGRLVSPDGHPAVLVDPFAMSLAMASAAIDVGCRMARQAWADDGAVVKPDGPATAESSPPVPEWRKVMYAPEAATYLGLDVKRPENALGRLIRQGVLPRKKIGGRLAFSRADLDRVITQGGGIKTGKRGRPKGSRNKRYLADVAG